MSIMNYASLAEAFNFYEINQGTREEEVEEEVEIPQPLPVDIPQTQFCNCSRDSFEMNHVIIVLLLIIIFFKK